ncbi:hypothetical protein IQ235_13275 [Oscillatoriales cyanobacterium LEGE 11467]|uniref:Uncharacterized protein n=1 Tax=Zarconia navalis LEGE 11467 TaxID=1828826 RepID=A0A928VX51_9CYAN|nr:hypothetical protein [Zarconia navalis]MBE9041751.1 hypothetical protein [Zarconia navalis LEGE 11467]
MRKSCDRKLETTDSECPGDLHCEIAFVVLHPWRKFKKETLATVGERAVDAMLECRLHRIASEFCLETSPIHRLA